MEYGSITYDLIQLSSLCSLGLAISLIGKFFAPFNLPAVVIILGIILLLAFSGVKFYWLTSTKNKAKVIFINTTALIVSIIGFLLA